MTSPAFLSQPTIQRIPPLLEEVRLRQIVIPRFHRPFVWTDDQRIELMRSINEGLPIGSLLVWRTKVELETHRLPGSISGSRADEEGPVVRQYLLDGIQRVTTLFTALNHRESEAKDREVPPFRAIYFDLHEEEFVLDRGMPLPAHCLPLNLLFSAFHLFEFLRSIQGRRDGLILVNRAEQLAGRFKDYAVPMVPIVTEDLEVATTSFRRISSRGTPMSEVQMVVASTYGGGVPTADRIEGIRDSLQNIGWGELDEQVILNVCKARLGVGISASTIEPLIERISEHPEVFHEVETGLELACGFLAEQCDVLSPKTLPYSQQLVLIASILGDMEAANLAAAKKVLFNWFWATTYSEYFLGMSPMRIRRAWEHLRRAVEAKVDFMPDDIVEEVGSLGRFDPRNARSRAIALGMADRYPTNPGGESYSGHRLLALHGGNATPKLFIKQRLPKKLADGFENRFIADPDDVRALREKLLSPIYNAEIKMSHGIDARAAQLYQKGDVIRFLERRRDFFLQEEKRFVEDLGLSYIDSASQ